MTSETRHPPEPLQTFRGLADAVAPALRDVETAHAKYREEKDAGRGSPNSVEALRVELTYNSNAIEGGTLSLRETQLVLEGYAPPGGYPHAIIEVAERAEYLAALEEANAGRCARFAAFVLRAVERSIWRLVGQDDAWKSRRGGS